MKKIEIEIPEGKNAKWVNGVLTLVDEKPKNVMERIKTFKDACDELGCDHPFVKAYDSFYCSVRADVEDKYTKDVMAYLKLRIITTALNEGWEPEFTKGEYRYFPWFCFYTEEEIKNMSKEGKKNLFRLPGATDYGGVAYAYAGSDSSDTGSSVGSRLAFKNSELAKYAGKQFIDIWADYIYYVKK